MSEWITLRLPTSDDADDKGFVGMDTDGRFQMVAYQNVVLGDPWYPLPKAYVPPKPKRRRMNGGWYGDFPIQEVLPDDPADLDALLEAIDSQHWNRKDVWIEDVLAARKPKELCPHGNPLHDCNKCDWDSDSVNNIAREQ